MPDLSCVSDLHHSLWQHQIFTLLSMARDWTHVLMNISQILKPLSHNGNSITELLITIGCTSGTTFPRLFCIWLWPYDLFSLIHYKYKHYLPSACLAHKSALPILFHVFFFFFLLFRPSRERTSRVTLNTILRAVKHSWVWIFWCIVNYGSPWLQMMALIKIKTSVPQSHQPQVKWSVAMCD